MFKYWSFNDKTTIEFKLNHIWSYWGILVVITYANLYDFKLEYSVSYRKGVLMIIGRFDDIFMKLNRGPYMWRLW